MLVQRCRLLLKRIYNSIIMFNQDDIATAQIAQIFGSELLKVQNSARTDGGSTPQIVKMDPKQFLVGNAAYSANAQADEQRISQILQREAEAAYPIEPSQYTPPVAPELPSRSISALQPRSIPDHPRNSPEDFALDLDVLARIALSLERIANAIDKLDIKPKKKIVKRKPKYNKAVLLNEINS